MTNAPRDDRRVVEPGTIVPGRFNRRFAGGFGWYVQRLMRKRFNAVRLIRGDDAILTALADVDTPIVAAINHPAWWDPLTALVLSRRFMPERTPCAPMDAAQLRRFGLFRRLGVFGVEPDAPDALQRTVAHVAERFATDPRPVLWITPQGRFTDVREPIRLHPGAAAVAARHVECRVVAVAVEYTFWQDQRPEVLLCCTEVARPAAAATTSAWHRAVQGEMQANAERLATAACARDEGRFMTILGGRSARIHPMYDAWLRLRGRHGAIIAQETRSPQGGPRA